jgi:myo-inositol-1(or 4)-monophosphatase
MREKLDELLSIAKHAAQIGATVHCSLRRDSLSVNTKSSSIDLVTEIDRESERQIVAAIHSARPDDAIVGTDQPE